MRRLLILPLRKRERLQADTYQTKHLRVLFYAQGTTMATKKQTGATKLRVLVEGAFGKPDDVIELEGEDLAQALASGQVDANPEAVAYAESLQ